MLLTMDLLGWKNATKQGEQRQTSEGRLLSHELCLHVPTAGITELGFVRVIMLAGQQARRDGHV